MVDKILAVTGLSGAGAVIGGGLGGLLGLLISGVVSIFYIIPYFTAQTQTAPDWFWVAVVIALIPSAIVVLIGLVVGIVLGAVALGLPSMVLTIILVNRNKP
jgi:hypothetical protein